MAQMANSDTFKLKTQNRRLIAKQPECQVPEVSIKIQLAANGEKLDTSCDLSSQSGRNMAQKCESLSSVVVSLQLLNWKKLRETTHVFSWE